MYGFYAVICANFSAYRWAWTKKVKYGYFKVKDPSVTDCGDDRTSTEYIVVLSSYKDPW